MLTKTYPYGTGEAFIEQEIEIASGFYENITIYCCQVSNPEEEHRKVPKNVHVVPIKAKTKKEIFLKSVIVLLNNKHRRILLDEMKKVKSIKKKLFAIYFYAKSRGIYEGCEQHFKTHQQENICYLFYSYWFFDIAYVAILLQEKFGIKPNSKVISRAHRYDLYVERNPIGYFPFREIMLDKLNMVYACSMQGRDYLREKYPDNSAKIETAYLGTKSDVEFRGKRKETSFHIVTCSYIDPVKRVKRVAEACKILEERVNNIRWTCFGDGMLKNELVQYCNNNLKKTKVEFKGFCSNQEIHKFYEQEYVDLFVNVSSSEGLPVSIMEAMSYGIPCIATNVGGTSEIVKNQETGYLLEENFQIEELSNMLYKYANISEEEKKAMRIKCRDVWKANFDAENTYMKFYQAINKES